MLNVNGHIVAARDASMAGKSIDNAGGLITGRDIALEGKGGLIDNTEGKILANRNLSLVANEANNSHGLLAGRKVSVALDGELYSVRGNVYAKYGSDIRTRLRSVALSPDTSE